jgi:iron(III) transport system permease protein
MAERSGIANRRVSARWRKAARRHGPIVVLSLIMLLPFGAPTFMLIYGAFRSTLPGLKGDHWSLDGFRSAYSDSGTYASLRNSLILACSVTILAVVIAIALAWIAERTDSPGRRLVTPVMIIVFATPALFFGLGWTMLANKPVGVLNKLYGWLFDTSATPFDINTWYGLVFVSALKMTSVAYLLLLGPMKAMSRSLEEASLTSGAGRGRTLFRIQIPVLAPAISGVAVLTFVIMMSVVDLPLLIGTPAGITVYSTQIYEYFSTGNHYSATSALAFVLTAAVVIVVLLQQRLLRGRSFATVSGKGYSQQRWNIGKWRWVAAAGIALYALLAVVLPVGQVIFGSFQPIFGVYGTYTWNNYRRVFTTSATSDALQNTLAVGIVVGFIATALALVIAYVQRRSTSKLRGFPGALTWVIMSMPGIVFSVAVIWGFLFIPGLRTLYGTVTMVMIALVVHSVPIAMRATHGAIVQIGPELEESARVAGASSQRTLVGIVGRLLLPSFLAAWVVTGLLAAGNLDIPLLMSASERNTVPVLVYQFYTSADLSGASALLLTYMSVFVLAVVVGLLVRFALRFGQPRWSRRQQARLYAEAGASPGDDLSGLFESNEPAASSARER